MVAKTKKLVPFTKSPKFFLGVFIVAILPTFYFAIPKFFAVEYLVGEEENVLDAGVEGISLEIEKEIKPKAPHIATPEAVKAIYMTSCVAGTPSLRDGLVKLIEETELNSVIIDIKDYSGTLSFKPENAELYHAWENARCGNAEMKEFVAGLHEKGIYAIGRITVFQDPHMANRRPDLAVKFESSGAVWKDNKGLSFTDPGSKEVWDYHMAISRESFDLGFDELNFDYIRFPSDGPMKDIYFPFSQNRAKTDVLEEFFSYLHKNLKDVSEFGDKPPILSADLFGMTTTNTDDLNIGQVLERTLPYFDYVAPMVYPSHYPKTWHGFENPNNYPYEVVNISMTEAVRRALASETTVKTLNNEPILNEVVEFDEIQNATTTKKVFSGFYKKESFSPLKMRPWIQDFDYGGDYGPAEVRAQIQATYDAGLNSWMIWSPSNKYTREALLL